MAEMEIDLIMWDYWIEDPIDRGSKPLIIYVMYQIGNTGKLKLMWRELNDDD